MSSTKFSFKAKVMVGGEVIPLASEITSGQSDASDGVQNGFLFKLDLNPGDPPITINLGDIIGFIENKLGSGDLSQNSALPLLQQAFPGIISGPGSFTPQSTAEITIGNFVVNSSSQHTLFSISVGLTEQDPTQGLIPLPPELANWLNIESLSISLTANTTS